MKMYHLTNKDNTEKILQEGLKVGESGGLTEAGDWADEVYEVRPIYLSTVPVNHAYEESTLLEVDVSGLDLVADLPSLIDHGANVDERGLWWEEGELLEPFTYLLNDDIFYFEEFLEPNSPVVNAAIETTKSAAILEDIPPERIKMVNKKKANVQFRFAWHCPSLPDIMDWQDTTDEDLTEYYTLIDYLDEHAEEIEPGDFFEAIGGRDKVFEDLWANVGDDYEIEKDYHISWYKSYYPDGTPVYYHTYSGIEHVYEPEKYYGPIKKKAQQQDIHFVFGEELLELDILNNDPWALSQRYGVNVLSDKDFFGGHVDFGAEGGLVVSALFDSYVDNKYSFDVVVHRLYRRQGLAKELIEIAMDNFRDIQDMDPEAELELDVINKDLISYLQNQYNLKVVNKEGNHTIMKQAYNIDKSKLHVLWYENKDGDIFVPDLKKDPTKQIPDGFCYQLSQFPNSLNLSILRIDENGSTEICRGSSTWPEDLVLTMANSGDFTLSESILVASNSCERCINSLAYDYGLDWGYEEGSEEWQRCGTECEFCKELKDNVFTPPEN